MAQTPPRIQGEMLTYQQDGQSAQVAVNTADWYSWLETASTFTFCSEQGSFTAHKERAGNRRGGTYWRAYRRRHGTLHRAYLGKSKELTLEWMRVVAARLAGEGRAQDSAPVLRSDLTAGRPPLKTPNSHPPNLPVQPTPLIGREQEVAKVCAFLRRQEVRLMTLTGPGGIGKTRLGVQVASELSELFVDGVFFVDLAPLSDPALVVPTIAQRLGIWEGAGQSVLERLKEGLHQKQVLLLLDNFEQVLSAAVQVADLLTTCPRLKVLVTSRERLHVRAEQEFSVPPLALPDTKQLPNLAALAQYEAVAFFIQRAQAARPDFAVTNATAPAVAEICVRLDGLPLAIELAAARLKLLSPQALLTRLAQRLQVLTKGAQDAPARQRTLRDTIAWSCHLLGAEEHCLFRRFAVFVGGCTLEAVEAIYEALGDETGKVFDGVTSLIDKSLLQQRVQREGESRLVMLETIREYGLECLESAGEREATRQVHAAYYLALAEEAESELKGPQQAVWLERLEQEHDNLRAALGWFLEQDGAGLSHEMALRLGGALWQFWSVRGHFSEGRTELARALAGSGGVVASVRAKALSAAADLAYLQSDDDWTEALSQESLLLYREVGDTRGIAFSLSRLAWVATRRGNFAEARSHLEESLELNREVGDKDAIAWSLFFLADNASMQGEYTRGHTLFEESLAMFRELRNERGMATALKQSAVWLFVAQGDRAIVRAQLEESLALFRELGDKDGMAFYSWLSGWVALSQGDTATAHTLVEQSLALWRELGNRWYMALSLGILGKIAAQQGDLGAAHDLLEESLTIARASDDKWLTAFCLEALAEVVMVQGESAWAARLWGAAEALRDMIRSPLPPIFRADYEHSVAAARTQLGEKAFTAAWAEGRTMTPEQVFTAWGPVTVSTSIPPVKPRTTYPNELTDREMEVLRLVAQGLTNRQVADQLFISHHYVNWLLTKIYRKLGVSSRSAATRRAIEQHLL